MPAHKNLTGSDLHEPKGAATAAAGTVYMANGSGSGSWQPIVIPDPPTPTIVVESNTQLPVSAKGSIVVSDGTNWPVVPVGAEGASLTVDAATTTGVSWQSPQMFVRVAAVAHGFTQGTPVLFNGTAWVAAQADTATTVGTHVVRVVDVDNFLAVMCGVVSGMTGLVAGERYFVSEAVPGTLTSTEPLTGFSNLVGQALSTTELMVFPYRAQEIA